MMADACSQNRHLTAYPRPMDIPRAMSFVRTLLALWIAAAVTMLPIAGAGALQLNSGDMTQASASEPMHDCCPQPGTPCEKGANGCASMAGCTLNCLSYPGGVGSALVYSPVHTTAMPLFDGGALVPQTSSPPFRPPRI
jgi:hypothetical protein